MFLSGRALSLIICCGFSFFAFEIPMSFIFIFPQQQFVIIVVTSNIQTAHAPFWRRQVH